VRIRRRRGYSGGACDCVIISNHLQKTVAVYEPGLAPPKSQETVLPSPLMVPPRNGPGIKQRIISAVSGNGSQFYWSTRGRTTRTLGPVGHGLIKLRWKQ